MASPRQWARARFAAPRSTGSAKPRNQASLEDRSAWAVLFYRSGGNWGLESPKQHLSGGYSFVNAKRFEDLNVGRVVDSSHGLLDLEVALGHLQRDEVVLVIRGDRDDRVGALDARL